MEPRVFFEMRVKEARHGRSRIEEIEFKAGLISDSDKAGGSCEDVAIFYKI